MLRPKRGCSSARCEVTAVWPHRLATRWGELEGCRRVWPCQVPHAVVARQSARLKSGSRLSLGLGGLARVRLGTRGLPCDEVRHLRASPLSKRPVCPSLARSVLDTNTDMSVRFNGMSRQQEPPPSAVRRPVQFSFNLVQIEKLPCHEWTLSHLNSCRPLRSLRITKTLDHAWQQQSACAKPLVDSPVGFATSPA